MNTQHTGLPWIEQEMPGNDRIVADDGTGRTICEFPYGLDANSAFIVRAVNAHDELVSALQGTFYAVEMLAGRCTDRQSETDRLGPACQCKAHVALRAARAALAKAGEA